MIQIEDTIVSLEVFKETFVCDITACKGQCCVEGDAGAPLEKEELALLDRDFEKVEPYLTQLGIQAIEKQGRYLKDEDGDDVTPLVNGKECAYAVFDKNGTAKCGIEQAWENGATDFRKPISCHLYPIRITKHAHFQALNYNRWNICSSACELGKQLKTRVFEFLKDALIRKYGKKWYAELKKAGDALDNENF